MGEGLERRFVADQDVELDGMAEGDVLMLGVDYLFKTFLLGVVDTT